jgi:hypothetical protein
MTSTSTIDIRFMAFPVMVARWLFNTAKHGASQGPAHYAGDMGKELLAVIVKFR